MCISRWLDEGEDDHKIVRELRVQDEYMDDILEKRNVSVLTSDSSDLLVIVFFMLSSAHNLSLFNPYKPSVLFVGHMLPSVDEPFVYFVKTP